MVNTIVPQKFFFLTFLIATGWLVGCGALPRVETPIHEDSRGKIFLKAFANPSMRAQHPASIDPIMLKAVLNRLYVRENQTMLESALMEEIPPVQAFSPHEISFLLPHLISGLQTATPEEEVVFQLNSSLHHKTEFTKASLYLMDSTIYMTVFGFRETSSKTLLSRPSTSFNRPKLWTMHFYPGSGLPPSESSSQSQAQFPFTFSVNLPLLAQVMKEQSQTPQASPEGLEDELQELRESLRDQNEKLERLEQQIQ